MSETSASKPRWTWLKCAVAGEGKVQLHLFKPNVAISQLSNCSQRAHFSKRELSSHLEREDQKGVKTMLRPSSDLHIYLGSHLDACS